MKKLFLHIGMPKTGSSAIQAFLLLNAELLRLKGYNSPDNFNFRQPFQTSSGNAIELWQKYMENNLTEIETYLDEVCSDSYHTILSSEMLYGSFRDRQELFFQSLRNFDYHLIIYVRRQDNLYQSMFNQSVKHSNSVDRAYANVLLESCDFAAALLSSLQFSNNERIIVRPYEQAQFTGGTIYTDFLACLGLEWDESFVLPGDQVNPSLNREALLFRIFLNEIAFDRDNWNDKKSWNEELQKYSVSKLFGMPFQDHSLLTVGQRNKIIDKYAEKNKQIARLFLNRDDGMLFFEPVPSDAATHSEITELEQAEVEAIVQFVFRSNKQLVVDLYRYIFQSQIFSVEFLDKKKNYLSAIRSTIMKLGSRSDFSNYKKAEKELIRRKRLLTMQTNLFVLTTGNFFESTCNYSPHIKNGSIGIKDDVVVIQSVGKDPYWEFRQKIQKGIIPILIRAVIEPPQRTMLQVFYQTESEPSFTEEKSVKCQLKQGANDVTLMIDDCDFNGKLRIDPGKAEGEYKIGTIAVKGMIKKRFWPFK